MVLQMKMSKKKNKMYLLRSLNNHQKIPNSFKIKSKLIKQKEKKTKRKPLKMKKLKKIHNKVKRKN